MYNATAYALRRPANLLIRDAESGRTFTGGSQEWYPSDWQQRAGCGPTTGANLTFYIAGSHPGYRGLFPYPVKEKKEFIQHMEDIWRHITPGNMGVNTTDIFVKGGESFSRERGLPLTARQITIPAMRGQRPAGADIEAFIHEGLDKNLPVAFLNLSNGRVSNLDNWHWVTLVAHDPASGMATIYDQGQQISIDFSLWLRTTRLGGGLVYFEPSA